jgi:hypothetical protein
MNYFGVEIKFFFNYKFTSYENYMVVLARTICVVFVILLNFVFAGQGAEMVKTGNRAIF